MSSPWSSPCARRTLVNPSVTETKEQKHLSLSLALACAIVRTMLGYYVSYFHDWRCKTSRTFPIKAHFEAISHFESFGERKTSTRKFCNIWAHESESKYVGTLLTLQSDQKIYYLRGQYLYFIQDKIHSIIPSSMTFQSRLSNRIVVQSTKFKLFVVMTKNVPRLKY